MHNHHTFRHAHNFNFVIFFLYWPIYLLFNLKKLNYELLLWLKQKLGQPEVRDQLYDEKANTVTIIVVCCSPEKIRDKLCYKGGKVIKSIEIKELGKPEKKKEPEKPKEPAKPKEPEKPKVVVIEKPKEPEKPKVTFLENPKAPADKPKDAAAKPKANGKGDKPKSDGAPPPEKPKEAPKGEPAKPPPQAEPVKAPAPVPANGVPSVFPYIGPSYDGYNAGPYYHGYGFPQPPPQPCYEGYYGNGHEYGSNGYGYGNGNGNGYGYGRVVQGNRYDNYLSEENPQGCSIM